MSAYFTELLGKMDGWGCLGLVGQLVFASRFLVQWLVSESRKESTIPVSFWWLSITGSLLMLTYGFAHRELPVILGQIFFFVYVRNLMLIYGKRGVANSAEPPSDL